MPAAAHISTFADSTLATGVFSTLFLLVGSALGAPLLGWTEYGPERGHVIDVVSGGADVRALTRIGVVQSTQTLDGWVRDPRFPVNTRQIAGSPADDAFFALTPTSLFLVSDATSRLMYHPPGALAVDVVGHPDGSALVAMRGGSDAAGVWKVDRSGNATLLLGKIDPWSIREVDGSIWVATLDQGVWVSAPRSNTFRAVVPSGAASVIGEFEGEAVVGWSGGRITDATGEREVCTIEGGTAIGMQEVGGVLYVVADTAAYPFTHLYACSANGIASAVDTGGPDDDAMPFQPTGIWPLSETEAIVGTFRAGPAVVGPAGLQIRRSGFRATLGVAAHQQGSSIVMSLMSTGVFRSDDDGKSWVNVVKGTTSRGGVLPVSDTSDVYLDGDRVVVVDFDGLTVGENKLWTRIPGVELPTAGRRNALVEVSPDGEGRVWARDFQGGLWQQTPAGWASCVTTGVLRFDGRGADLRIATEKGYLLPDSCNEPAGPAWPGNALQPLLSRVVGDWGLAPGGLYHKGAQVTRLPEAMVQALAVRAGPGGAVEILAAFAGHPLFRCAHNACENVAAAFDGPLSAVGWLGNGQYWALERRGTFQITKATSLVEPVALTETLVLEKGRDAAVEFAGPAPGLELDRPPWRELGSASFQDRTGKGGDMPPDPRATNVEADMTSEVDFPWSAVLLAEGVVGTMVVGFAIWVRAHPARAAERKFGDRAARRPTALSRLQGWLGLR